MSPSNRNIFWQHIKIARKYKLKTEEHMKLHDLSFLKEICGVTNKRPDINKLEKLIGYLRYEVGQPITQIARDLGLALNHIKEYNKNLLDKLGIRSDTPTTTTDSQSVS